LIQRKIYSLGVLLDTDKDKDLSKILLAIELFFTGGLVIMRLSATVEIDKKRGRYWLRINKKDSDNKTLIYDNGPEGIHETEVTVQGSSVPFRIWWKSRKSTPYLQALCKNGWSFDEAYHEVQRITNLPMDNPFRNPNVVNFNVHTVDDQHMLFPLKQ
jgi:hypothetical protein